MFFVENVGVDVLASMNTHASLSKKAAGPLVSRGKTKDSDNEETGGGGSPESEEGGYESPGCGGRGGGMSSSGHHQHIELDERKGAGGCGRRCSCSLAAPIASRLERGVVRPMTSAGAPSGVRREDTVPLWAAGDDHAHVPQKLAVAAAAQHSQHSQGGGGHSHGILVLHPMVGSPAHLSALSATACCCIVRALRATTPAGVSPWRALRRAQGRKLIVAHLLEFGVVVHSVIIGLDLGVMTEDRGGILGLAVVLARRSPARSGPPARESSCGCIPDRLLTGLGLARVLLQRPALCCADVPPVLRGSVAGVVHR